MVPVTFPDQGQAVTQDEFTPLLYTQKQQVQHVVVLSEATRFLRIGNVHVRSRVLSRTSCRAASARQSPSPGRSSRLLASRSRTRATGFRQGRSRTPGWIDMAAPHEIRMLMDIKGNEAKAKCDCQQKVYQHHLDMEIPEAEFQWWQKLIFYYYADHYVNSREVGTMWLGSLPCSRLEEDRHGKNYYTSDCPPSNDPSQQSTSRQPSNMLSQTTCSAKQPSQSNNLLDKSHNPRPLAIDLSVYLQLAAPRGLHNDYSCACCPNNPSEPNASRSPTYRNPPPQRAILHRETHKNKQEAKGGHNGRMAARVI
ncbi:hypothetical protein Q7P36_008828 [Cladosporium allicinum]